MALTNENMDTADQVNYLGPEAVFSLTQGGFVSLDYRGKTYEKVNLRRLLPFTDRSHYISVLTEEEEIGILRDLEGLPQDQQQLIQTVLRYKYFTPRIVSISQIKDRMGYLFIKAQTTAGPKNICVADYTTNIRQVTGGSVSILDAEGNRYLVDDLNALDKKSFSRLDLYL